MIKLRKWLIVCDIVRKLLRWGYKHKLVYGKYLPLTNWLGTPKIVWLYMNSAFTYVPDIVQFGKVDYLQTAMQIFNNEKGDCEDFAAWAKFVMNKRYKPRLIRIGVVNSEGVSKAHVICIYQNKWDDLSYLDTGDFHEDEEIWEQSLGRLVAERTYPGYQRDSFRWNYYEGDKQ